MVINPTDFLHFYKELNEISLKIWLQLNKSLNILNNNLHLLLRYYFQKFYLIFYIRINNN